MSGIRPDEAAPSPRVTVAIPVYNSATTLARCIQSASAQTLRDIEILVADDASTDGSAAIAEAMALDDRRIRVIRLHPNGGKPRAMNRMIAEARGEWIAVLDADDTYLPERLDHLVRAAERSGVDMAADNLLYWDAGVDRVLRTGFDPALGVRVLGTDDLVRTASSFADFDLGILKPVVRRRFVQDHGLQYYEGTRLAEDFYYLLMFFVAGGRACVVGEALYRWTMPFGTVSRRWTGTGGGAWRYDYRPALQANQHFIGVMQQRGEAAAEAMLHRRSRQYRAMIPYLDAQRQASEGRWLRCAATIAMNPQTFPLLAGRIVGRVRRALRRSPPVPATPDAVRSAP